MMRSSLLGLMRSRGHAFRSPFAWTAEDVLRHPRRGTVDSEDRVASRTHVARYGLTPAPVNGQTLNLHFRDGLIACWAGSYGAHVGNCWRDSAQVVNA